MTEHGRPEQQRFLSPRTTAAFDLLYGLGGLLVIGGIIAFLTVVWVGSDGRTPSTEVTFVADEGDSCDFQAAAYTLYFDGDSGEEMFCTDVGGRKNSDRLYYVPTDKAHPPEDVPPAEKVEVWRLVRSLAADGDLTKADQDRVHDRADALPSHADDVGWSKQARVGLGITAGVAGLGVALLLSLEAASFMVSRRRGAPPSTATQPATSLSRELGRAFRDGWRRGSGR